MLLQVNNLTKKFGTFSAVKDLSFAIDKGRCVALLGPNGAGKTTTLNMIAGVLTPTTGSIQLGHQKRGDRRQYIGFLPQYPKFYHWMNPTELLQFVGQLSGLESQTLPKKITDILQLVGLEEVAKKRIGGFSGGMKQRLGLAQALLHEPDLLLLDEPVSSLDPVGRREVMNLLHELKKETTIFFSTHVLHDAEEICDDIFIMNRGVIEVAGGLAELKKNDATAILKIKTAEPTKEWLPQLEEIEEIFQVTPHLVHCTIPVEHVGNVKTTLLESILSKRITLECWEVAESSLEDLFLKVVRK